MTLDEIGLSLVEKGINTFCKIFSYSGCLDKKPLMTQVNLKVLRGLDVEKVLGRLTRMCSPS